MPINDKTAALAAVRLNGLALQYAPEELRADREVVLAAVAQKGWALCYASASNALLKADPQVLLAAVAQRSAARSYVPSALKADPNLKTVAENPYGKSGKFSHKLSKTASVLILKNQKEVRKIFVEACKGDSSFLQYLPELFRLEVAQMRMVLACAFYHSLENVFQGREMDLLILQKLGVSLEHIMKGREAAEAKAVAAARAAARKAAAEPEPQPEAEAEAAAEAEVAPLLVALAAAPPEPELSSDAAATSLLFPAAEAAAPEPEAIEAAADAESELRVA